MFLEGLVLNIANFSQSFLANVESGKKGRSGNVYKNITYFNYY